MANTLVGRKRIRKFFGKIREVAEFPHRDLARTGSPQAGDPHPISKHMGIADPDPEGGLR
jgi:hypothetical protein